MPPPKPPQTCTVCSSTEGERIITDLRFTTAATQHLYGQWEFQLSIPASAIVPTTLDGEVVFNNRFTFHNDGTAIHETGFADWESAKPYFVDYIILSTYMEYMMQGMDNPAAEADILEQYGMTMEEYAIACLDLMDVNGDMESVSMVYYVEGDTLYMAYDWNEEMEVTTITLNGDTLTQSYSDGETVIMTRINE